MKIVCYTEPQENGLLLHYPSLAVKSELLHLWEGAKKKYNGYMTLTLDKPYKSRTTGEGSQNSLFWKLVQIICDETGEEPKEIERELKMKAIAKNYPYHISKVTGQPVPESMTKINTVQMSYLIDTAYEVIAFLGIVLEPTLRNDCCNCKKENEMPKGCKDCDNGNIFEYNPQIEKEIEEAENYQGDIF